MKIRGLWRIRGAGIRVSAMCKMVGDYCYLRPRLESCHLDAIAQVRRRALLYAERLRVQKLSYGAYRYKSGDAPPILYASVFAALLRHLLSDLDNLTDDQRHEWIEYINSHQCEDGLYRDPLVANQLAEREDSWGWRHLTLLVLIALNALGGRPAHALNYLEIVSTQFKAEQFVDSLDWGLKVAFTSNRVQNYCAAMQYVRDFLGGGELVVPIQTVLHEVTKRCHSSTGIWGEGFCDRRTALSEGVQAGYHFWLLYLYDNLEIPFEESAVRSILQLQNLLGGFSLSHLNSSACEDIDGVDPLVRLCLKDSDLCGLVRPSVRRAVRWVLSNFSNDGGAWFQQRSPFFFGHELMATGPGECSLFATWFRMLSIGVAFQILSEEGVPAASLDWRFVDAPGYQFSPSRFSRKDV